MINAILTTMRPHAAKLGLTFRLELPAELPMVSADLDGLTQAIGALIDNAVKFSPDGGQIFIAAHVEEGQLRVSIQDPGVGIPPDQMNHIFDRYHHMDSTGEHLFGGVGLGLPIAKQVVEQHSGAISVIRSPPITARPRSLSLAHGSGRGVSAGRVRVVGCESIYCAAGDQTSVEVSYPGFILHPSAFRLLPSVSTA